MKRYYCLSGFLRNLKAGVLIAPVGLAMGLISGSPALADNHIGNGGGSWVCTQNGAVTKASLVDLYEGQVEFGLTIPRHANLDYVEILERVMVRRVFPISDDLYRGLNEHLETVKSNLVFVNADLEIVDDALYRIRPPANWCTDGSIEYRQLANYTTYGRVLVDQNLFGDPALSDTDKAALLLHEAIYAYRRELGDENSVTARRMVGLFFSNLSLWELREQLENLGHGRPPSEMSFVHVGPGTFWMGSPESEAGRNSDERRHQVTLTQSFEVQTTEVTQAQWVEVMGTNPSKFQTHESCPRSFAVRSGVPMCPNHPVENVSWSDIQQFLTQLNATRRDGYFYRLPTEAQWEYAARGGHKVNSAQQAMAYFFGNDPSQLFRYDWYWPNSGGKTHEVDSCPVSQFDCRNPLGLYGVHGNVWEWVQDWYGDYPEGHAVNPTGPASGSYHVLRSGSWNSPARRFLRSASRAYSRPGYRYAGNGFRLVRTR